MSIYTHDSIVDLEFLARTDLDFVISADDRRINHDRVLPGWAVGACDHAGALHVGEWIIYGATVAEVIHLDPLQPGWEYPDVTVRIGLEADGPVYKLDSREIVWRARRAD